MTVAQQTVPPGRSEQPAAPHDRPPRRTRPSRSGAGTSRTRPRYLTPAALLTPAVIVLAVIIGWPLLQLIIMSFQGYGRAQVFGAAPEFIWFGNYVTVLTDPTFWQVLGRSVAFCLVNVVLTVVFGTACALLMQRLNRFFRLLLAIGLLLAWAMPPVSSTIVWGWLFDTQYGVINYVLTNVFGMDMIGHSWLIDPLSFFAVATIIVTWGAIPFVAFTIYAGLTQVPDEVLEAASLDGASAVQRFRLIIVPYLRSVFVVVIVLSVIWDLRVFTQIYALQGIGGNTNETNTIGVYIYKQALGNAEYGIGGAIAVILVLLLLGFSYTYVRQTLREEER